MAFNKTFTPQAPPILPLEKRLWKKFKNIIKYPFTVGKKFTNHMRGISVILAILKYDKKSQNYQRIASYIKKDAMNRNAFIYLWIFLAVFSAALIGYKNKQNYIKYWELMKTPVHETRITAQIGEIAKKAYYAVRFIPISKNELMWFSGFYLIAIIGARFCSYNPIFKEQEHIQAKFLADGKLDEFGNPWLVVWTREAILIKTYGNNDDKMFSDRSFWTDINFMPTTPKSTIDHGLRFLVFAKKQEINRNMTYSFDEYFRNISEDPGNKNKDLNSLPIASNAQEKSKIDSKKNKKLVPDDDSGNQGEDDV